MKTDTLSGYVSVKDGAAMTFTAGTGRRGFTMVELLVTIGIIGVLSGLLLTGLSHGIRVARDTQCRNNLRQLGLAVHLYTVSNGDYFPPTAVAIRRVQHFWWGANQNPPDFERGFLAPYLGPAGRDGDVYQCPEQPPGTYRPEGVGRAITTTYGYNGYYLAPASVPGWGAQIRHRPWQTTNDVDQPHQVFMFADTLLPWRGGPPSNTSLLDPPFIFQRGMWTRNQSPTTCFRHSGRANVCFVDGSVRSVTPGPAGFVSRETKTGFAGRNNAPHYVPDFQKW